MGSRSSPPLSAPRPLLRLYACTGLLIVLLLATNAAIIMHLRESELLDQEGELRNLSLTLAEQAERSFQSVDLVLSSVAERIRAEGVTDSASLTEKMGSAEFHRLLQDKLSGSPQIEAVTLIRDDGRLVNFSRRWPPPDTMVDDRQYFRVFKADSSLQSYLSAPVRNRANSGWTIFLVRRLNSVQGEFIGLVLGAINLRYFEDFYGAVLPGEGSTISIMRQDGVMLGRYPPVDTVGQIFATPDLALHGGVSGTVRDLSPTDGLMRIKAAHLVASYPVLVLATKTVDAALRNWVSIARLMSLGSLGCAISIAIAGFALGRQWQAQTSMADAERARALAETELRRQEDLTASFEAMRAAKEAAERANRSKTEFLATMSHELRTPLNAILGFSDMMMCEVIGPLGNDRYRGYAQDIHASGSHLLDIINDVLDLSKAVAGKLELSQDWFDARGTMEVACRLVRPRITEANLRLIVTLPPAELVIYADARKLKQMLLNLLSNAYKFTPSGGRIECKVTIDEAEIIFAVTDSGIGIPAVELDRVLQPFAQVDSSMSREHDGTGLGLALVKAMAELHGGRLLLESEEGIGTT
ncbi:MAG TPA: ATP-binding protein, partial [Stellaceae bacterium]|nr:ATP-binding protein [Stellaceae bacterium]